MSKPNPLTTEVPKLYQRGAVHLLIYGFMNGVQWAQPGISKKEAAEAFIKRFAPVLDNYGPNEVTAIYDQLNQELRDHEREANSKER